MKIVRNEVEIELTDEELFQAHQEQEQIFIRENVQENMQEYIDKEIYEQVREDEDFLNSAFYWYEKYKKDFGCDHEYSLQEAFREAIRERDRKIEQRRQKKHGKCI